MVLKQTDILFEKNSIERTVGSINDSDSENKRIVLQDKHRCHNLADLVNIAQMYYSYLVDKALNLQKRDIQFSRKRCFLMNGLIL